MSDLPLLSAAQMRRLAPLFPRSRGLRRVDDRRVISGIIYVIRHGLQWKDAPRGYGPHRRCTTGSSAGAGWVCSRASSPPLPPMPAHLSA